MATVSIGASMNTGVSTYSEDGVAVVRGLLSQMQLDELAGLLDEAESLASPMASELGSPDGRFFNDFNTWRKNSRIWSFLASPSLLEVGPKYVGTESVRLFHDHILIKEGLSPETPWHQDRPYYLVAGPMNYSIWMSPEPVAREEGLEFIKGSHLTEALYLPVNFKDGTEMMDTGNWEFSSLDKERLNEWLTTNETVGYDLDAGDAIVFDNRILHRARRSTNAVPRRALSIRYLGDHAYLTWRGVNQTPPLHRMGLRFSEGDMPTDAWFPRLLPN